MANEWLRLWHDMPNDPKWRTISRISKQRIGDVIALYTHLLVIASKNKERGSIKGASAEDLAAALDMDEQDILAILSAMSGRVIDEDSLSGWAIRQPIREDGGETSRSKNISSNYVYYVGTTNGSSVKIGVSKNPWSRISDLQAGSNEKYELFCTLKTPNRSEYDVHKFFAKTRKNGEWFQRSNALNALIEKIKNKEIQNHEECLSFLESLSEDDYKAVYTTTKNYGSSTVATKDKDKEEDKENIKTEQKTETIENVSDDNFLLFTPETSKPAKPKKPKSEEITFNQFIEKCLSDNLEPIPANHAVIRWAEASRIPENFIIVAWEAFKAKHVNDNKKRQADWPATFYNYCKLDYLKVWAFDREGTPYLTTAGKNFEKGLTCER